jgi:hypothetical protein
MIKYVMLQLASKLAEVKKYGPTQINEENPHHAEVLLQNKLRNNIN